MTYQSNRVDTHFRRDHQTDLGTLISDPAPEWFVYNPLIKKHILSFMQICNSATPHEGFETLALQVWSEQSRSNPEYGRWSDWVLNKLEE